MRPLSATSFLPHTMYCLCVWWCIGRSLTTWRPSCGTSPSVSTSSCRATRSARVTRHASSATCWPKTTTISTSSSSKGLSFSLSVSPIHPTKVVAKNVFLIVSLWCFIFNEFALAVHVKHSTQILGFLLICLYFTTGHFHTCTLPRMQPILYSLLILSSAFSNCVVFYGDFDINAKNIIPTLCGSGCLLPKLVIVWCTYLLKCRS